MQINLNQLKSIIHQIITENTPDPKTLDIMRKLQKGNSKYNGPSTGQAYDQHIDPKDIIPQLANLRREQPKLFTPEIEKLIKDKNYEEALNKLQSTKSESRKHKKSTLKEINSPPRQPKKSLELIDQGLKALDTAIDLFHKAMDADPITHERKPNQDPNSTLLHHILTLENTYDSINEITPNPISPWGSLPGEDHTPVDTGKYNPRG